MNKRLLPWLTMALAALSLVAVAAVSAKPAAKAASAFKGAIITDIGGLNDRGFNQLANQGRLRAQAKLKIKTRVYISKSNQDYVPNLTGAARAGNNLVISIGFLMVEPTATVARAFPNTKFAMIDGDWTSIQGEKPSNVRGLLFKEQESGYLVGYLAGLELKRKGGSQVASAVGGLSIPPVNRFIAGYKAGLKKANAKARLLIDYSQDFVDQAKCKEVALNQIARGSQVVFQVAGGCGLGALSAAKEKGVWGIGVDADQAYLGSHVLTSAVKKVDVAVFLTMKAAKKQGAKFKGGFNQVFGIKTGAVGYGKVSKKVPKSEVKKLEAIKKLMLKGKIKVPSTI